MDPHITVLAPSRPLLPITEAISAFNVLQLQIMPFQISACRLHRFSRHRRHTLVLAPDNNTHLMNLFNTVVVRCNWQETTASTKRPYQPHITLVNQVSDKQLGLLETELTNLQPEINFVCTEIGLYAKQSNWDAWQELQRLSISAPNVPL